VSEINFKPVCDLLASKERPLGDKLRVLRLWREQIERAECLLTMQLGVDAAKYLFAAGVQPTGGTVAEAFERIGESA
jgi:hypothetical protein